MSSYATTMNSPQDGQQHKFTRYKSVRKASRPAPYGEAPPPPPPPPPMPETQLANAPNVGLSRSMSRYKRPRAQTATESSGKVPVVPTVPRMPSGYSKEIGVKTQNSGRAAGANTSRQRNTSMPAVTQDQAQKSPQSRSRPMTGSHQQAPPQQHPSPQDRPHQQSRRDTQSHRTPQAVAEMAGVYMDPYAQMNQSQQFVVQVPTYQVQGQTFAMPVTEEDRVRQMIESDKARQRRLRDEQKRREAKLAAEKAEQQRQQEEEQRKKEEETARKEEEERLVKEKLQVAKREHAERKKQQSRGLFSRGGAKSNHGERRQHQKPSSEYSQRYENVQRPELTPPSDKESNPRPYQSPPRLRKESISQPLSPTSPVSPSKRRNDAAFATAGRLSISQRPAEPFFDAPQTAANAGERSVIVCRGDHKSVITVEPDTTVEDLLSSAAREMPRAGVDPKNDVLMECFSQQEHQGLERRMRRYEVVQKVMDSWDSDRKNKLGIIPGGVGGTDDDLQANAVSRRGEPERSTLVRMYYSCATPLTKPSWGTFDKPQLCILRPDGQVLVGKGDDERGAVACCHMSDFEIFIPTPEQMRRIKPKSKKMYVFAVKSQSKAAVYMESNNYVHYFSTKDRGDADRWYVALQSWRSWYMVERLGFSKGGTDGLGGWIGKLSIEKGRNDGTTGAIGAASGSKLTAIGEHSDATGTTGGTLGFGTTFMGSDDGGEDIFSSIMNKYDNMGNAKLNGGDTGNKGIASDGLDLSKDALGYDLGGLISRIPMNEHSYEEGGAGTNLATNGKPLDRRGGPPVSYNGNRKLDAPAGEGAFAPSGLLGRSYSQRKAQQEIVGRTSLDHRSRPTDGSRQDKDWGKPLVDLSAENHAVGGAAVTASGAGPQIRKGTGPLIGRI